MNPIDETTAGRTVGEVGELELLRLLGPFLVAHSPEVPIGVGDDAAAILLGQNKESTLVTTDILVEGTHFPKRPQFDWFLLGWKAMAANLSDIAAMGGEPRFALVSLGLPAEILVADVLELYRGMCELGGRFGVGLIGGDTVSSPVVLVNVTVLGTVAPCAMPARRSGCRVGHTLFVSGELGSSAAGLEITLEPALKNRVSSCVAEHLFLRHWRPTPRVELGRLLAAHTAEIGMMDISDSLVHELHLLGRSSRVGFRVELARLPIAPAVVEFCLATGRDPFEFALFGGEEYELVFSAPVSPEQMNVLVNAAGLEVPVHAIGTVISHAGRVELVDELGRVRHFQDRTYEHFRPR